MKKYTIDLIKAIFAIPLYFIKELQSLKVAVLIFLCYLLWKGIDSLALQITIPFVFGYLFHLRSKQKTKDIQVPNGTK